MSLANEVTISSPGLMEGPPPYKKRRFHRDARRQMNGVHKQVGRGCFNCNHHLSKYYYWKESPCDTCCRSPEYYYRPASKDLPDKWEHGASNLTSIRNSLY